MKRETTSSGTDHIPQTWQGTLSANASTWKEVRDGLETPIALLISVASVLFVFVVVAPIYYFGVGLAALVSVLAAAAHFDFSAFAEPSLWGPPIVSGLLVGLVMFALSLRRSVIAFSFDADSGQLQYVEKRLFLKPAARSLSFESIVEVVPTLLNSTSRGGHFAVVARMPEGGRRSLWLGSNIPLETLRMHGKWLATHLCERVRPTQYLDC